MASTYLKKIFINWTLPETLPEASGWPNPKKLSQKQHLVEDIPTFYGDSAFSWLFNDLWLIQPFSISLTIFYGHLHRPFVKKYVHVFFNVVIQCVCQNIPLIVDSMNHLALSNVTHKIHVIVVYLPTIYHTNQANIRVLGCPRKLVKVL